MKRFTRRINEYYLSLLLMILTVLFWGLSFISTKVVLTQIPPISISFFRQLIAIAFLIPLALYTRKLSWISLKDLGIIASASFFGIVLYFMLENTGLQYTTASNAAIIVAALPAFTMLSEALLFKLNVSQRMVACLVPSIMGVYFVVTINGKLDLSSSQFLGNLLMLGAMISWVFYNILNRKLNKDYSSLTLATLQSAASIFLFLPFVLSEMNRWPKITALSPAVAVNLVFLGVFCSAFAYFFYIYSSKRLGITVSAAFLNLIPVVTVISGYIILGETLALIQIFGMGLIMAGIFGLNRLILRPSNEE